VKCWWHDGGYRDDQIGEEKPGNNCPILLAMLACGRGRERELLFMFYLSVNDFK